MKMFICYRIIWIVAVQFGIWTSMWSEFEYMFRKNHIKIDGMALSLSYHIWFKENNLINLMSHFSENF